MHHARVEERVGPSEGNGITFEGIRAEFEISSKVKTVARYCFERCYTLLHSGVAGFHLDPEHANLEHKGPKS